MENVNEMFEDVFKNTLKYKEGNRKRIILRRSEYEKNLDDMWEICSKGYAKQIVEYRKGLENIKSAGFKVYRNSKGKHEIVFYK